MTYSTTIERNGTQYTIEWEGRGDGWYLHVPEPLQDEFPHRDFDAENYTAYAYANRDCAPEDVKDIVENDLNAQ